jgi:hypothetical protein
MQNVTIVSEHIRSFTVPVKGRTGQVRGDASAFVLFDDTDKMFLVKMRDSLNPEFEATLEFSVVPAEIDHSFEVPVKGTTGPNPGKANAIINYDGEIFHIRIDDAENLEFWEIFIPTQNKRPKIEADK